MVSALGGLKKNSKGEGKNGTLLPSRAKKEKREKEEKRDNGGLGERRGQEASMVNGKTYPAPPSYRSKRTKSRKT